MCLPTSRLKSGTPRSMLSGAVGVQVRRLPLPRRLLIEAEEPVCRRKEATRRAVGFRWTFHGIDPHGGPRSATSEGYANCPREQDDEAAGEKPEPVFGRRWKSTFDALSAGSSGEDWLG